MLTTRCIRKLLLIQPPVQDFYDTDIRLQPIGLCYLKAAVQKYHPEVSVKVVDFHQGRGRATIALPKELSYLKKYYFIQDSSPFRTFGQYFHFGASFEEIADVAAREQPDMVGISSLFSPYYREVLQCAEIIKKRTGALIIVGGSHVSGSPETMLASPYVDYIIRGEGERPLVELLHCLAKKDDPRKVAGLGYKDGDRLHLNDVGDNYSADDLEPPDFSDLSSKRYLFKTRPICMVMSSRGCPHRCSFCSVQGTFGKTYRPRAVESIVDEMEKRYRQGFRVFDFEDDNLTFNKERFKKLCEVIIEKFAGKDIQLLAMNGVSYKSLDRELLQLMREAGFTHLNLALVSSNEKVLAEVKRPHRVDNFTEIVEIGHELGFQIVAYQILGLPNETIGSMMTTLLFLARLPVLIGVSTFYLTPGAAIAEQFAPMDAADILRSRSTAMAIETEECKRDHLYTLFITARILNFLKGLQAPVEHINLNDLLASAISFPEKEQSGLELLRLLFAEKCLYAQTKKGLQPVVKFDNKLFFQIWTQLDFVRTQGGGYIIIN